MVTVLVSSRTVPPLAISEYDLKLCQTLGRLNGQDGARQRRLAVINVPDRTNVDVRLGAFEKSPWPCLFFLPLFKSK